MTITYDNLRTRSVASLRQVIRRGDYTSHTAGLGPGMLQANLAIMPETHALDFMRFCQRNPKPCPLSGVSDTGNPMMLTLGADIDIRTDVPSYNVYRDGVLDRTVPDIRDLWQDDFVAFALGCSFTFENALQEAGIPLWHITQNKTVPMFRSGLDTVPAGPFSGKMVVSMRMVPQDRVDDAIAISSKYPLAHGAPVHWGDPVEIGIHDLTRPDWGEAAPALDGHVPVFWACGVTPQVAIESAGLSLCITHRPGAMLITDVSEFAEVPNYQNTANFKGEQQ